jgi:hypothetical protein
MMSETKGLNGVVRAYDGYGSVSRNEDKVRILAEEEVVSNSNTKLGVYLLKTHDCP